MFIFAHLSNFSWDILGTNLGQTQKLFDLSQNFSLCSALANICENEESVRIWVKKTDTQKMWVTRKNKIFAQKAMMLGGGPQTEISDKSRKYGQNLSTSQKFLSGDPRSIFWRCWKESKNFDILSFSSWNPPQLDRLFLNCKYGCEMWALTSEIFRYFI